MIFSPLSEIPSIGSTSIYVLSALLFVACQLPVVLSHNLGVILVFRLITGIFASPCLSLGGASIKAMYSAREQGIPMAIWDAGSCLLELHQTWIRTDLVRSNRCWNFHWPRHWQLCRTV